MVVRCSTSGCREGRNRCPLVAVGPPIFRWEIQGRPYRLERLCYVECGTVEDASTDTITRSGETALGKQGGGCRRSPRPAHPARSPLRAAGMPASVRCRWKTAAVARAAGRDA